MEEESISSGLSVPSNLSKGDCDDLTVSSNPASESDTLQPKDDEQTCSTAEISDVSDESQILGKVIIIGGEDEEEGWELEDGQQQEEDWEVVNIANSCKVEVDNTNSRIVDVADAIRATFSSVMSELKNRQSPYSEENNGYHGIQLTGYTQSM